MAGIGSYVRAVALSAPLAVSPPAFADSGGGFSLEDMVRQTQLALLRVQEASEMSPLPPLSRAVLEINTRQSRDARGRISFFLIEAGGGETTESVVTSRMTLVPPDPGTPADISDIDIAQQLTEAILAMSESLSVARQGNPPLIATEVEASIRFTLERSADGGLNLSFAPFTAQVGGGGAHGAIQSITVTYALD